MNPFDKLRTAGSGAHTGFSPDCKHERRRVGALRASRTGWRNGREPSAAHEHPRSVDIIGWLLEQVPVVASVAGSEPLLALGLLLLTATLVACGVPGVLLPISFSSGVLLGGWVGMLVVVAGAVLGSQALFVAARHWRAGWLKRRWGARLSRFDRSIEHRGFYYLLGLRLVGAPHMLVTTSCALSAIPARSFVLATLIGFLPAVATAAMAGSVV